MTLIEVVAGLGLLATLMAALGISGGWKIIRLAWAELSERPMLAAGSR